MVNPYCALCQVDFCSFAVFMSESSGLLSLFIAMRRLWLFSFIYFLLLTKMKVNIRPGGQAGAQRALERSLGIRFLRRSEEPRPSSRFYCNFLCSALCSGWGSFFLFSALLFTSFFSTQHTHTHSDTHTKQKKLKSFI